MTKPLRTGDYKIGCLHGKRDAKNPLSEAQIQRTIYSSQRLMISKTRNEKPVIRIIGYEVPLEVGKRGKCVDLMGYDNDKNLYIIELKKEDSNEKIDKAIEQLNDYAKLVENIKHYIEKESEETFFIKIAFKKIIRMIIAPRDYYKDNEPSIGHSGIIFGCFRDTDFSSHEPKNMVNITLKKY